MGAFPVSELTMYILGIYLDRTFENVNDHVLIFCFQQLGDWRSPVTPSSEVQTLKWNMTAQKEVAYMYVIPQKQA